ncbi:hypothetical protein P175DRAFT_0502465 [Aspergillus ochraceoroseus IBT 24754]|uniref:Uncharacterized protein n=1 Tax=Aspergillus ochraceoroseus IBT 24754 TaxID=1392256 RepID=A0A2T5LVL5_9EURO|nr:uncharacterized protein P175DRAFT_0502465 [Aspergillus ochraceoroseus IBT 24754]PTU20327.1 hypothetical protein P175DRAFT_0502465 [Aspergillus ochraceoroseus IBT 24754]
MNHRAELSTASALCASYSILSGTRVHEEQKGTVFKELNYFWLPQESPNHQGRSELQIADLFWHMSQDSLGNDDNTVFASIGIYEGVFKQV